jgi:hypothetical protein
MAHITRPSLESSMGIHTKETIKIGIRNIQNQRIQDLRVSNSRDKQVPTQEPIRLKHKHRLEDIQAFRGTAIVAMKDHIHLGCQSAPKGWHASISGAMTVAGPGPTPIP